MKTLIDGRLWGLENAGLGRYTMRLVENLSLIDKDNEYAVLLRKKYFDEVELPRNWTKVLVDVPHYTLREQIVIPKIIEKLEPDVSHFLHFNVPIFGKTPFVVTIHDLLMHKRSGPSYTTLSPLLYYPKRLGFRFVFKNAIEKSRFIITPSHAVAAEISLWFKTSKEKIKVIYEGVDLPGSRRTRPEEVLEKYNIDTPYFIYVGNLYPHKNIKRAIEAVSSLNKFLPRGPRKVFLLIVSSRGAFFEKLRGVLKSLSADEQVRFVSNVKDDELYALYEGSKAFVFPSFSEGFGLPGLEAMTAGTLCLASDIPVFREIYKDGPFYFNPYDFSSVERAMRDALTLTKAKRAERIKKGREIAKNYSWRKTAEETLSLYGQIQI